MSRVLVVLPTLGDRLDTLRLAIDSVTQQNFESNFRLVVVVPQRSAAARNIAAEAGATVVDDPGTGLAAAMNAGVSAASGEEFYVGLGDDDLLRLPGIRKLLDLTVKKPKAVVYYGGCDYIDSEGRIIGVNRVGMFAALILAWGPDLVPHPGTLIRLSALESVGGFNVGLPYAMDLDVFLKLKRVGRFVSIRESTAAFRWHQDSLTVADRGASAREALDVKRAHLPGWVRPVSRVWLGPVAWATEHAGRVVNYRASKVRQASSQIRSH